ncbi:MAG: NAD(+) synthase [Bacteroidales bacterium]|nr:NAD(+) synthase [Bacteroidales bacterium]
MKNNKDYGFLRVATAVPSIKIADPGANASAICSLIDKAFGEEVSLLAFPELCVTGFTCADLFGQDALLDAAEKAVGLIREHSRGKDITIIVGTPVRYGGALYDCAVVIRSGNILGVVPRIHPGEGGFGRFASGADFLTRSGLASNPVNDDGRNRFREGFSPLVELCSQKVNISPNLIFKVGGARVAVEVGGDLLSPVPPSSWHVLAGAEVIVNVAASEELVTKDARRREMVKAQSARGICAYLFCSCGYGESTTDVVYGGASLICERGRVLAEDGRFKMEDSLLAADVDVESLQALRRGEEAFGAFTPEGKPAKDYLLSYSTVEAGEAVDTDFGKKLLRQVDPHPFVPDGNPLETGLRAEEILSIQVTGLVRRLSHIGCRKAVIGVSGGLDSTLALLVTVFAFDRVGLPREGIIGITMPGFGTTGRTRSNAEGLMKALGVTSRKVSIVPVVNRHFKDIGQDPQVHDVTFENAQARERTQILMDIANKENGLVVGTGDLSELALGWCTFNGDHMSMYGVNAGVPKTLVRSLVRWAAENRFGDGAPKVRGILLDIVDTPISPELTPAGSDGKIAQKTEDIVGPYELHDFFLYHFLRFGCPPSKLFFLACKAFAGTYDRETILKWLKVFCRRFFSQQFKRSCMPDGPKVGTVGLSPRGDWSMASDASSAAFLKELEDL